MDGQGRAAATAFFSFCFFSMAVAGLFYVFVCFVGLISSNMWPFVFRCWKKKQTGEETFFKIKKTTKMQKVFETYAQRKGVQVGSLRFMLDGERIDPTQTPKMLELDDQDQIDCLLEQVGGDDSNSGCCF